MENKAIEMLEREFNLFNYKLKRKYLKGVRINYSSVLERQYNRAFNELEKFWNDLIKGSDKNGKSD